MARDQDGMPGAIAVPPLPDFVRHTAQAGLVVT